MTTFRPFTCCECGGKVKLSRGKGRTRCLEAGKPLPIPDAFLLPICKKCGETFSCPEITGPLDALLRSLRSPGARPRCTSCGSLVNFESISGIPVYLERQGKMVYRTRCSQCGRASEIERARPLPASWSRNHWEMD